MLRVKTYIGNSSIAGIGLFAAEFIPKGSIIWEYTPEYDREYSQEEFDKTEGLDKEFLQTYCFRFNNKFFLCVDNGRFFNHSNSANCYSVDFNESSLGYTKSLCDIEIGTELTDDYLGFGFNDEDKIWNTQIEK